MHIKVFVSLVATVITVIFGVVGVKNWKVDNSVEKEVQINQEEILQEVEEVNPEEVEENNSDEKIDEIQNNEATEEVKNEENINKPIAKMNENKAETTKTNENLQVDNNNIVNKTPEKKKEQENKGQPTQVETPKVTEEYIYNEAATNKLIADIDEIAKRNKDLWGEDGKKLYNIKPTKTIIGKNYMCPYNYSQVEGKVLNVYSVTFLVYAVDYKKTGFATETRYYIDITNFKN